MKKKIALLLASIMALSPVSAFASTNNSINGTIVTVKDKTVLMESTWKNNKTSSANPNGKDIYELKDTSDDVKRIVSGSDLVIKADNANIKKGDTFDLVLTNSEWYFAAGSTAAVAPSAAAQGSLNDTTETVIQALSTSGSNTAEFASEFAALIGAGTSVTTGTNTRKIDDTTELNNGTAGFSNQSNFDRELGTYLAGNKTTHFGAYLRFGTVSGPSAELPYMIRFNDNNKSIATVTVLRDAANVPDSRQESYLKIPMVVRLTGAGDATAQIANSNNGGITSANYTIARVSGGGKTNTTVEEKVVARNTFELKTLAIKEEVIGTIQDGRFYLTAPYGYTFADPQKAIKDGDNEKYLELSTIGGLKFYKTTNTSDGFTRLLNKNTNVVRYANDEHNKLVIDLTGTAGASCTKHSYHSGYGILNEAFSSIAGTIYIENLVLLAEDYAPFDKDIELKLTIDKDHDPKITEQAVVVGTRKDWIISLEAKEPIPTLVNGRLAANNTVDDYDGWHKTAQIKFSENVVASWWEERDTELTLPEGVKFMAIEIDDSKDFDHGSKTYELDDTYNVMALKGTRDGYVKVAGNKVTLTDLSLKTGKKGSFVMDSWVSIESGFEGDVTLTAGGTGVPYEVPPVTIAKAVSPITIDTQVTDVKIGYQWQKVADFTINETGAGRLVKGKEVKVSIDDAISQDEIFFAPDSVVEKAGNISFTKPAVNGGNIIFTIDRASNGSASAIKFSNVYVKVDRTVPESNNHPYKILVGGNAVAANYVEYAPTNYHQTGSSLSTTYYSYEPVFSTKGIGADYLNVITAANDKPGVLSNLVKVTIGSDVVLVGRNNPVEVQMDTAAYISADSNSTMVPVRFVAVALGIPDGQIAWDDENRTVTINYTNTTVQFKAGGDQITVNGVTTTMYSPDNPPRKVVCEVKDNRTFLPFRQLGYALGVPVDWDDTTRTAIYNNDAE